MPEGEDERFTRFLKCLDEKFDSFRSSLHQESLELIDKSISANIDRIQEGLRQTQISENQSGIGTKEAEAPDTELGRFETRQKDASAARIDEGSPGNTASASKKDCTVSKTVDFQAEFAIVRDSVSRLKLPVDLKFNPNSVGINREDKGAYSILRQSASYVETTLKIVQLLQLGQYPISEAINDLQIVNTAHIKCLKEEHATILVQGKFSKETAGMFKALRKEGNSFSQDTLDTLQIAANLTRDSGRQDSSRGRGFNRGRSRPWRGRGYFNNRDGRDNHQFNRDVYSKFVNQEVPSSGDN